MFLLTFSGFQNVVSEIAIEIIAIVYKRLMLGHVKHGLSQAVMKWHVNSDLKQSKHTHRKICLQHFYLYGVTLLCTN